MIRRHIWWVAVVVMGAIAMLWPRFADRESLQSVSCTDIVAGCALPQEGARVRFDRQPDALQRFRVLVTGVKATGIHVSFRMQEMEMGLNRYQLLPDGSNGWQAEVMLPACIQGRKDWLVILEIEGDRYALPFESR